MIKMNYFKFEQPIGTLYMGVLKIHDILDFTTSITRYDDRKEGIQRKLDPSRLNSISKYSNSFDATFPTPIILAGKSSNIKLIDDSTLHILLNKDSKIKEKFLIVDGQHRLYGIEQGGQINIEVPVILILDTTLEQNIQIFSVINANQKPVSKSLIYDLFGSTENSSLEKTCHLIAQELNSDLKSPFYTKLKMLGTTTSSQAILKEEELKFQDTDIDINFTDTEIISYEISKNYIPSLSQGIFIDILITYITNDRYSDNMLLRKDLKLKPLNNEKYIFRNLFINGEETKIYLILRNYFNAIKDIYPKEWDSPEFILSKSTGYIALMQFLALDIYPKAKKVNMYNRSTFREIIKEFKDKIKEKKELTSKNFGSSKGGANELYRYLTNKIEE